MAGGYRRARARLWSEFQRVIGTNTAKQQAIRSVIERPGRLLEIGCATGNLADAFPGFSYVGVDTNAQSVAFAAASHPEPSHRFHCLDILEQALPEPTRFDYVLLSHTAHHLPDGYLRRLIRHGHELLEPGGTFVLLDMIRPAPEEPFRRQFYYRLDRGQFFRSLDEFRDLLDGEGSFPRWEYRVVPTRKWGIEVIDQILMRARSQ